MEKGRSYCGAHQQATRVFEVSQGTTQAMLQALADLGPMTAAELCLATGTSHATSSRLVSLLAKPSKLLPKRIYISGYTYDGDGGRPYPRAIYSLGCLPNVAKPIPNPTANRRKWFTGKQKRVNSVWALGSTRGIVINMGARA